MEIPPQLVTEALIGFSCENPEQADLFHDTAVAERRSEHRRSTRMEGEPAPGRKIYLAYVSDPSGHKLCAIYNG